MSFNKNKSPILTSQKIAPVSSVWKRKRSYFLVFLLLVFLSVFPFLIYEMVSQTFGVLELSDLEKTAANGSSEYTLIAISNYFTKYSPRLSILRIQLHALERIKNPTLQTQIKKIRLIKILLQQTWFPDHTLYKKLGEILYEIGYYREALHYLEKYVIDDKDISISERIHSHVLLYNIYMLIGNYQQAIKNARSILLIDPQDLTWTLKLAKSYIAERQFTSARKELEKLMYFSTNNPLYYEALFDLIDVLTQLNLNDKTDFYLRYMASSLTNAEQREQLLSTYAKYLIEKVNREKALERWQASYLLINPNAKIKNLRNDFEKYLKS